MDEPTYMKSYKAAIDTVLYFTGYLRQAHLKEVGLTCSWEPTALIIMFDLL